MKNLTTERILAMLNPPHQDAIAQLSDDLLIESVTTAVSGGLEVGSVADLLLDQLIQRHAALTIGVCAYCNSPLLESNQSKGSGFCGTGCYHDWTKEQAGG